MIWTILLIVLVIALIAVIFTAYVCWLQNASLIEVIILNHCWMNLFEMFGQILGYLIWAAMKIASGSDNGGSSSGGDW